MRSANKKVDVLRAIRPILPDQVHQHAVRGQYDAGWIEGNYAKAYRQEDGVSPTSHIETFAAVKFFIDNWRWQDVPFYLRTGKRLPQSRFRCDHPVSSRSPPILPVGPCAASAKSFGYPYPAGRRDHF